MELILAQLQLLGAAQQHRLQATLGLQLFERIVRYADLSKEKTFQLAFKLWLLALKLEVHLDAKLLVGHAINQILVRAFNLFFHFVFHCSIKRDAQSKNYTKLNRKCKANIPLL